MKIVHMSSEHIPLDVRIFYKECRTLAAAGHDVHLLVQNPPCDAKDGVRFHRLIKPWLPFLPLRFIVRRLKVFRSALALRGEVYHFHDPHLLPVGFLLKAAGCKVIYDAHEDAPREALTQTKGHAVKGRCMSWTYSIFEAVAMRWFNGVVAATPTIGNRFPRCRTEVIHNYPLLEEFGSVAEVPWANRDPLVIYAGGIAPVRSAFEIVEAMNLLPASLKARLSLAGPFSHPDLFRQLQQGPGWKHCEHLGYLGRPDLAKLLGRGKIGLVMFYPEIDHLEALPNKLFEYMASGLPIIASNFPLWKKILKETGAGITADPLDPRSIADAIRWILEHPAEAEEMGRRGKEATRSTFNWETEGRKLVRFYDKIFK